MSVPNERLVQVLRRLATPVGIMVSLGLLGASATACRNTGADDDPSHHPTAHTAPSPGPAGQPTPGLAPLQIEVADTYVIGFPVFVAITVSAKDPRSKVNQLPRPSLSTLDGVDVVLRPAGGGPPVVKHTGMTMVIEEHGMEGFDLRPGEKRRMLLELASLLPKDVAAGAYDLQLMFFENLGGPSPPTVARIELRDPSPKQRTVLARLASDVDSAGGWGAWTFQRTKPAERAQPFEVEGPSSLTFAQVLRRLRDPAFSLQDIPLTAMRSLAPPVMPEALVLEAELWAAQGNSRKARPLLKQIGKSHPGLRWRVGEIEAGCSRLRDYRPDEAWWPARPRAMAAACQ